MIVPDWHALPLFAAVSARTTPNATRKAARESADTDRNRALVLAAFTAHGPMTNDECAALMGWQVTQVRPRTSKLFALGDLRDTGETRLTPLGSPATVWDVADSAGVTMRSAASQGDPQGNDSGVK